jgi:hypothetical protein
MTWTIWVPLLPGRALSPNSGRGHQWYGNANATEELRNAVTVIARTSWSGPPLDFATVSVRARISAKRPQDDRYRPLDVPNLVSALKPAFDGLVVAGVCVDDRFEHFALGAVRIERVADVADEGLWITVLPG